MKTTFENLATRVNKLAEPYPNTANNDAEHLDKNFEFLTSESPAYINKPKEHTKSTILLGNVFDSEPLVVPAIKTAINSKTAYYRSKLLPANANTNALINAATPLFTIVNALKNLTVVPDLLQLYQDLCHEIRAFENQMQTSYHSHIILAARYSLCTLIDETILTTSWGSKSEWKNQNLLNTFQQELYNSDKFFLILERSVEDPETHIDLLELMYICLSLGYQGKYRYLENGYLQLTEIIDTLYENIQQHRSKFNKKLFLEENSSTEKKSTWDTKRKSIGLVTFITLLLLIIIYSGFDFSLNKYVSKISQKINQLNASTKN